ncbi:hypothetical protein PR048_007717 [Dryococelus australis]|uniref:Uncharacterized protein n=1 Tax=Dryococelus australis TaxID=614101 RepID=A0ABQ9HV80_9NEOP|nr:hypothetical protein PR048_007717 [Dryococelus australis]
MEDREGFALKIESLHSAFLRHEGFQAPLKLGNRKTNYLPPLNEHINVLEQVDQVEKVEQVEQVELTAERAKASHFIVNSLYQCDTPHCLMVFPEVVSCRLLCGATPGVLARRQYSTDMDRLLVFIFAIVSASFAWSQLPFASGKGTWATMAERLACSPPTGFNPRPATPGFSRVGIVPDDDVSRQVFLGISRFPRPFIQALFHTHLNHPHRLSRPRCQEPHKPLHSSLTLEESCLHFIPESFSGRREWKRSCDTPPNLMVFVYDLRDSGGYQQRPTGVKSDENGAAPKRKVGGNGIYPMKPADQRHRPARFTLAKIRKVGMTHVHLDAFDLVAGLGRVVLGHVSEELLVVLVPLDGVEGVVAELVVAHQLRALAPDPVRRHDEAAHLEALRTCKTHTTTHSQLSVQLSTTACPT